MFLFDWVLYLWIAPFVSQMAPPGIRFMVVRMIRSNHYITIGTHDEYLQYHHSLWPYNGMDLSSEAPIAGSI